MFDDDLMCVAEACIEATLTREALAIEMFGSEFEDCFVTKKTAEWGRSDTPLSVDSDKGESEEVSRMSADDHVVRTGD